MKRIISIPCLQYDFKYFELEVDQSGILRIEKLINEALSRLQIKMQYELFGKMHNYQWGEGYALDLHSETKICVISGVCRDISSPFAIFPVGDINSAARYFVWLVSKGDSQINWDL